MRKERIDVRVEPELLEELELIAEREGIKGRSAAVREAVASYVIDNKDGWNATALKINIPNRLAEKVQRLIINGDARSAEEAIILALDGWTSELEDYYINRRNKIEKVVAANVKNDAALRKLRKETLEQMKR